MTAVALGLSSETFFTTQMASALSQGTTLSLRTMYKHPLLYSVCTSVLKTPLSAVYPGKVKPTRMSALLNAALGYVSDRSDGFVDFDSVPDDGASVQVWTGVGVDWC